MTTRRTSGLEEDVVPEPPPSNDGALVARRPMPLQGAPEEHLMCPGLADILTSGRAAAGGQT